MDTTDSYLLRLSEVICSRICHDLVGPISALANGLEFGSDQPEMRDELQPTLTRCARVMTGKTKFYRLAFGRGGYDKWSRNDLMNLLNDYLIDLPVTFSWITNSNQNEIGFWGKPILHMTFHATQILLRGGNLDIDTIRDAATSTYLFRLQGKQIIKHNFFPEIICDGAIPAISDLTVVNAPATLTWLLLRKLHLSASLAEADDSHIISLRSNKKSY